ncbi:HdeD family acid-resistance protein [Microbacterium sp. NPDC089696]|uniref:HdeD family acid-resistance protein n=1 Tax=Microbacterium sp. NPDC089696 TaxID=3364199 RepID=UPI0037FBC972
MSDPLATSASSLFKSIRITLAVSGVIALLTGIVLLVWPGKSLGVITGIFAVYLVIAGLVYIGLGIFSAAKGGWARVGHIVLGLLYIVAGVIAFTNLRETGTFLAFVIVIFIGVSWIIDGVVSLTLLGSDGSRVWTLLFALLSIVAGIIVIVAPLESALILWVFLGVSLVVLGIVQIVRAITIGKDAQNLAAAAQPDPAS